jgi:hypothetical protein
MTMRTANPASIRFLRLYRCLTIPFITHRKLLIAAPLRRRLRLYLRMRMRTMMQRPKRKMKTWPAPRS